MMRKDRALTAQEVADILKIAKNTVYELAKRGDIHSYKVGRSLRFSPEDVEQYLSGSKSSSGSSSRSDSHTPKETMKSNYQFSPSSYGEGFVICGQDLILDVLSNYIENHRNGVPTLRAYIGSYSSLISLYYGKVHVATSHLWDGDTDSYNVPFAKRLVPGIPTVIIHLAKRTQGFYVKKGNPKKIVSWDDLKRPDVTIVNREKGAGSRVLLDEHLRKLGVYGSSINGYYRESQSHVTVASTVARGDADVGIGDLKTSMQFSNIDFIPMAKERYEIVVRKEELHYPVMQAILEILNSEEFKSEFREIEGYDISEMGSIVAET